MESTNEVAEVEGVESVQTSPIVPNALKESAVEVHEVRPIVKIRGRKALSVKELLHRMSLKPKDKSESSVAEGVISTPPPLCNQDRVKKKEC